MLMATSASSKQRSESLLYPDRKRCRACRTIFSFIVLARQYCSYECAGALAPDAADRPRSCWTRDGAPKMGFYTPDEADRAARTYTRQDDPRGALIAYYCDRHLLWHIGHPRNNGTSSSVRDWYDRISRSPVGIS
jgi:hypothetical protein